MQKAESVLEMMEQNRNVLGRALYLACQKGDEESVKDLLEKGADPNWTGGAGLCPMHGAALSNHSHLIKHLLKYQADINIQTVFGYTPLHLACMWGHLEFLKELLETGLCDVELKTKEGKTPLDEARQNACTEDVIDYIQQYKDERLKTMKVFKEAIDSRLCNTHTIMHVCFQGNAGAGKTSLCKALTGQRANPQEPSTGLITKPAHINIRTVKLMKTNWVCINELQEEANLLVEEVNTAKTQGEATINFSVETEAVPTNSLEISQLSDQLVVQNGFQLGCNHQSPHAETESVGIIRVKEMVQIAVTKARRMMKDIEDSWTLFLTDVGGQLEFQELIPALANGPSVHVIVIKATCSLDGHVCMEYVNSKGEISDSYTTEHTAKEILLQTIATIMSITHEDQLPQAIIVLTFKDQVSEEKLTSMDNKLKKVLSETEAYRKGVIVFATETRMCHTINNLDPDIADVQEIRSTIEHIGKQKKAHQVAIPHRWTLFSIALREMQKKVLSLDTCTHIGIKCGLNAKGEIVEALKFLSSKIGIIRFFDQVPELSDIVITDPQLLFDHISELILNTFTFRKVHKYISENFHKKGIFPVDLISKLSTHSDLLTPTKFIAFLEYYHMIVPVEIEGVRHYFLPCALVHADLQVGATTWETPSLVVSFNSGYTPRGAFGFLVAELLTSKSDDDFKIFLDHKDDIFRDQITLSIEPYQDKFRFSVKPNFIIINLCSSNHISARKQSLCLSRIGSFIRRRVESSLVAIRAKLNYNDNFGHKLGLICTCSEDIHPAIISRHQEEPVAMICTRLNTTNDLPSGCELWFHKELSITLVKDGERSTSGKVDLDAPLNETDHMKTLLNLLWPIRARWKLFGVQLGVPQSQIDVVENNNKLADDCLQPILSYFLCQHSLSPKVTHVVAALRSTPINKPDIAECVIEQILNSVDNLKPLESKRRKLV